MSSRFMTSGQKTSFSSLLLLGSLLFPMPLLAEDNSQQLIEAMGAKAKALNYSGYFTYERGAQNSSYRILHMLDGEQEKQRLIFLDGEPLEIINTGHSLLCIHPGSKSLHAADNIDTPVHKLENALDSIWQYYSAEKVGEQRIANRPTDKILLKPKDEHRYPFQFYIDQETGLMLKMVTLDQQQQPLERFQYVSVSFGDVKPDDLNPEGSYAVVEHSAPELEQQHQNRWLLSWVPAGFKREQTSMNNWQQSHHEESLMYSDGVSAFSVFVEPVDQKDTTFQSRQGSTAAISQFVDAEKQAYRVTVIGEVPMSTAEKIAAAVKPAHQEH